MASHKYRPGDVVEVNSNHYGAKPGFIERAYYKTGIPFYWIDVQGIGPAEIREARINGKISEAHMKKQFTDRVDAELAKRLAMTSDEYTEEAEGQKKEVQANPEEQPIVPGGAPGPKSPEDIKKNPHEALNKQVVDEMGAKHKFAMDPHKSKEWWDSVTSGKTHKITACIEAAKSFADDPGAFCGALASEVNYKPE